MKNSNKKIEGQVQDLQLNQVSIEEILSSQKKFINFLKSKVGSLEIAEDIFQSSILKAIKNKDSLKDDSALIPWFYQILRNAVTDYYRENKKILKKSEELSWFLSELENETEFLKKSKEDLCACFKDLLNTLNPSYFELLNKVDLNGEDIHQVAIDHKINLNNATVMLHRARKALKKSLELTCGACTKHGCLNCTCSM